LPLDGCWRNISGVYIIEASQTTITLVRAMLGSASNLDEFRETKGEIGEEMVRKYYLAWT
jgi:hypothetical protein